MKIFLARPAFHYSGGKFRLALEWLLQFLPPHDLYVEPFCGAASVFMLKQRSTAEVINDLDGEIVNFFKELRRRPAALTRVIELTPYSREEYAVAWRSVPGLLRQLPAMRLERARRCYVRYWQCWGGGRGGGPSGWRFARDAMRARQLLHTWNTSTDALYAIAGRLKGALIECDDAMTVIERYDQPGALFYLDPPYLWDARTRKRLYKHEIDAAYHQRLLKMLQRIQGMAVISGYPSALYNEHLAGWRREETTARTSNTSNITTEVIWINPAALEALGRPRQLELPLDRLAEVG